MKSFTDEHEELRATVRGTTFAMRGIDPVQLDVLTLPIGLAGLMFCGVGIIIAILWNKLAFASLYHAVSSSGIAPVYEGEPVT